MKITLDAKNLYTMLKAAQVSAGKKDVRYYLNGAALHLVNSGLRVVSTDGHRLFYSNINKELIDVEGDTIERALVVGNDELKQVLLCLESGFHVKTKGSACKVTIELSETQLKIKHYDNLELDLLCVKLVVGKFPDYQRVLVNQSEYDIETGIYHSIALNFNYLSDIAKIGKILNNLRKADNGVIFQIKTEVDAVNVLFSHFIETKLVPKQDDIQVRFIIMPMLINKI
jgi:DNA polymerase-3 subunit beta